MPITANPRTGSPLPGEVLTLPSSGPGAVLRTLTDLADRSGVAPIARIPDLDPELDVIGGVLQPTRFLAAPLSRHERARIGALLEELGLARRLGRRPHQLGLDDLRRVALVRAVAARASIVVIDEPADGLSPAAADALLRDLRTAADRHGVALVLLTGDAAAPAAARVAA